MVRSVQPFPRLHVSSLHFATLTSTTNACLFFSHTPQYDTPDWSYPTDPNAVDFGYPRGNALPNTTKNVRLHSTA
jgi:hypothetical protein